jgi:hypothetical protein
MVDMLLPHDDARPSDREDGMDRSFGGWKLLMEYSGYRSGWRGYRPVHLANDSVRRLGCVMSRRP